MIYEAKASFPKSQILEATGKKSLFRVVDSLLLVQYGLCLDSRYYASLHWMNNSAVSFFVSSRIYGRALML